MKGLVDKAKIKKKYPWSKVEKPKVMAIPLNQFISTLRTSEEDNIKEIRVIPTPSSINVINQVNKKYIAKSFTKVRFHHLHAKKCRYSQL